MLGVACGNARSSSLSYVLLKPPQCSNYCEKLAGVRQPGTSLKSGGLSWIFLGNGVASQPPLHYGVW